MPKLLRLSGKEVISILQKFGFDVIRIRGSHYQLRRVRDSKQESISIPVHGNDILPIGTLKSIYRQASHYIPADLLDKHFYGE